MKKIYPFAGRNKNRSWFWWGINLGLLTAVVVWWWYKNQPDTGRQLLEKIRSQGKHDKENNNQITIDQKTEDEPPEEPDNLKIIEGIGPRSAQVLEDAGIDSFKLLSGLSPDEIQGILKTASLPIPFPETWPEQAALAAAGKWEELKDLQSKLVGGRRV